jgi:hypothetical protein
VERFRKHQPVSLVIMRDAFAQTEIGLDLLAKVWH